jgi:hypothetical protein
MRSSMQILAEAKPATPPISHRPETFISQSLLQRAARVAEQCLQHGISWHGAHRKYLLFGIVGSIQGYATDVPFVYLRKVMCGQMMSCLTAFKDASTIPPVKDGDLLSCQGECP